MTPKMRPVQPEGFMKVIQCSCCSVTFQGEMSSHHACRLADGTSVLASSDHMVTGNACAPHERSMLSPGCKVKLEIHCESMHLLYAYVVQNILCTGPA